MSSDKKWFILSCALGKEASAVAKLSSYLQQNEEKVTSLLAPYGTQKLMELENDDPSSLIGPVMVPKPRKEGEQMRGYVFMGFNTSTEDALSIIGTMLSSVRGIRLLTENPLHAEEMKKMTEAREQVQTKNKKLADGDRVMVIKGPFQDFKASVLSISGDIVEAEIYVFARKIKVKLYREEIIAEERE